MMIESGIGRLYIAIRKMRGMENFGKYVVLVVDLVESCYPESLLSCESTYIPDVN
jgi:hypothetical protein